MIKRLAQIALAAVSACAISCSPSAEKVKSTLEVQMAVNKGVDSVYRILNNSYETYHATTMDAALENFSMYLDSSKVILESIKTVGQSDKLTDAIESKIAVMKSIAVNESVEMVRIYKIPENEFNDELRSKWDAIAKGVEQKVKESNKKVDDTYNEIVNAL